MLSINVKIKLDLVNGIGISLGQPQHRSIVQGFALTSNIGDNCDSLPGIMQMAPHGEKHDFLVK